MTAWTWVEAAVVHALHDEQLAAYGGPEGIRDAGLIESALMLPVNSAAYGTPDAASLAAAYAFGLARNHGFVDGNKRTAWIAASVFLELNQIVLVFDEDEAIQTMLCLASGDLSEDMLAGWFRERIVAG